MVFIPSSNPAGHTNRVTHKQPASHSLDWYMVTVNVSIKTFLAWPDCGCMFVLCVVYFSVLPPASASPCLARYVDLHQLQWGLAVASQQQDCKKTEFISLLLLCSPLQSWKLALTAPAAIYKFVTGVCAAQ